MPINESQTVAFATGSLSVSQSEGQTGATNYVFTVERKGGVTGELSFSGVFAASGVDGADFVGGVLPTQFAGVIAAGATSATVTIQVAGDIGLEADESFTLTLNAVANNDATVAASIDQNASATGAILNDDFDVDLSTYVRVGRYDLPEPTRTQAPTNSVLAQEASAVTYNWDTDTLFIVGDGGTSITQVSKTGQLIDSMTLATGSSPQGTAFYDPEGLAYIGNGQFVMTEERDRNAVLFTYQAGTTLTRDDAKIAHLGTFVSNIGLEGLTYDPQTGGYIFVKETQPEGVFQTTIDFVTDTASNGSATTENSTNLFDPALANVLDLADVFALSNLPMLNGHSDSSHLLLLSQESGKIVEVDRTGNVYSSLTIQSDPGNPLDVASQQHEGLVMDRNGYLYTVAENGGGDFDHPQLWVYAPSSAVNQAPTAITLINKVDAIDENTNTATRIKVAGVAIADDGLGVNNLSLGGADAAFFEVDGTGLYIKAGTILDFETKSSYAVTVGVDDPNVGATPDATAVFTLAVNDVVSEGSGATLFVSEIAPWSSGNSPVGADWFEVTNTGSSAVDVTGWKMDDGSKSFASAVSLSGITSIGVGESVIFIETADLPTAKAAFIDTWFGGVAPAGLQIGSYSGGGVGLSTGGDAVNLYDANGVLAAGVSFGASPTGPFTTFNNAEGLDNAAISTASAVGVNGAFVAAKDSAEIGSPGTVGRLIISEVAPWSSGNSPIGADWFEVTNTTAHAIDITGWKMDDSSQSFAAAVALSGVTSIGAGESVIFIETANLAAAKTAFIDTWFGGKAPAGLQIGSYSGAGVGLGNGGDGVNLYDASGALRASVSFGASPTGAFASFDNAAGANNATISQLSVADVNGAFVAANDAAETGSPGAIVETPAATPAFSLQILHFYGESGVLADQTAPVAAAMIEKFKSQYANTITIAEGDTYIPGPWLVGGADPSLSAVAGVGSTALGRPDIAIMNAMGVNVSALGNHEFDLGSSVLQGAVAATGAWVGAQFPFVTANLDFAGDSALKGLADAQIGGNAANNFAGQEASTIGGKITPSTIVTINGVKIGVVGVTTFELLTKSSPTGTKVKDDGSDATDKLQEAAALLQVQIDALKAAGVDKILMVDQLDTLDRNKAIAPMLSGVDVMVAGGGHERLGDATDTPGAFNGHTPDFISTDTYPIQVTGADGKTTLIVTSDTEYSYVGRLVVDFDANGDIIAANLDPAINGAYASNAATLEAVYNNGQTADQIIAGSTSATKVEAIADAVDAVIVAKDSVVYGYTNVYLEGDRVFGRAQEVNLGDLTADANAYKARQALGLGDRSIMVSLKNGGGLRASIGTIDEDSFAKIGPAATANHPAGAITQLDVENALRFNNQLMVFDTTAQGLENILEYGVTLAAGNGGYAQLGGVRVSFDSTQPAGSRVRNISLTDADGNIIAEVVKDGAVVADAPSTISVVVLNFTANGGDGYPIKANGSNFRYLNADGSLSAAVDPALDFTQNSTMQTVGTSTAQVLGEQQAFKDYLAAEYPTPDKAYGVADTPATLDERIENLSVRSDVVYDGSYSVPEITHGPSTTQDPYLVAAQPNVRMVSLLSAGDTVGTSVKWDGSPWKMAGVPDGLGAFDNGDGTITVLMNHELNSAAGSVRAHGATGSFVSKLVIDKTTLEVVSASDLDTSVHTWSVATSSYVSGAQAFSRFCSADLPVLSAFYDAASGLGTQEKIFMNGEENGQEGRSLAHVVTGSEAGSLWELPRLGNFNVENLLARPDSGAKTVVIGLDDSSAVSGNPQGNVYIYVGDKQSSGTAIEKAGLTNGGLYGLRVTGLANELNTSTLPSTDGQGNFVGSFDLASFGDVSSMSGADLQAASNAASVTNFMRPEDGAWDPTNPNYFYFVTTASMTTNSRLWRLEFVDPTDPTKGGTIRMMLSGGEGQKMLDNMTIDADGKIILQEDTGNDPRFARVWRYDPVTDQLTELAEHDSTKFVGSSTTSFNQDEESSAVIDVTGLLGNSNQQAFLLTTQAHYGVGGEIVEGGQLQLMVVDKAGSADDTINAGAGDDTITGGVGNDVIDGGAGRDTAVFSGHASDYTITKNGSTYTIVDKRPGSPDGTDTVTNVETLQFADRIVSLMPALYDFDGDSASEILLQNAAGVVVTGEMAGGAESYAEIGGLGPEWSFQGVGDFLGVGHDQFMIENDKGVVVLGNVVGGLAQYTEVGGLGSEWKFEGAGDFLGSGRDQFLIENSAGVVVVGEVQNGLAHYTEVGGLGPEWKVVGVGDYLGDGDDDFLIENTAGIVVVGDIENGAAVYTEVGALGSEWKFVGTGDYRGLGHDQFLLENQNGTLVLGDVQNGHAHYTEVGGLGPEWSFVGTGDYAGIGSDAFMIQNQAGVLVLGAVGAGQVSYAEVGGLGPEWSAH